MELYWQYFDLKGYCLEIVTFLSTRADSTIYDFDKLTQIDEIHYKYLDHSL